MLPIIFFIINKRRILIHLNSCDFYAVKFQNCICNIFIFWLKKPRSKTSKTIAAVIAINILVFVVEVSLNMFYLGRLQVGVSLVVAACSVPLIIFFIALVKSRRLKAWVSRKFFV